MDLEITTDKVDVNDDTKRETNVNGTVKYKMDVEITTDKEDVNDDTKREEQVEDVAGITDGKLFGSKKEDIAYRHRFFHIACVCFSLFTMGWRNGLIGPTFPDLRLIIDRDLATASWIFSAISFGNLIGTIVGGYAYDRFNKLCVFMVVVLGMSMALETTATADAAVVWKHKAGPYMQAIHSLVSVGAFISPFVADPFLAEKITPSGDFNLTCTEENTSLSSNGTTSTTEDMGFNVTITPNIEINNCSFVTVSNTELYGPTRVYVPFFTTTFVCILASSTYLVVYFLYGNVYTKSLVTSVNSVHQRTYFLNRKLKIMFTLLLAITLTLYMVTERCFFGFLMTYVTTQLNWSKTEGSIATSTFWITFSSGRLSGIVIVKYINVSTVLVIFFSILTTGATLFLIGVIVEKDVLIWISVGVVGYGMSITLASIFSWLSENVRRLTGKMASILFICLSFGTMGAPILLGYLMYNVSFMWFVYFILLLVCVMFALFIFIFIVYKILERRHRYIEIRGHTDKRKTY